MLSWCLEFRSLTPARSLAKSNHMLADMLREDPYLPIAYRLVHSAASLSYPARSFLNFSAGPLSTASSGWGAASTVLTSLSTSLILFGGFHSSDLSIPKHMAPLSSLVTFGW